MSIDETVGPEVYSVVLPAEYAGMRFDAALAKAVPELSRSRLQKLIDDGDVRVDGDAVSRRLKVIGGEAVEIEVAEQPVDELQAEAMTLDIRYEDDDLLVLNKPAALITHWV